jgi:signal transduction histidine kinase/ligand-binding sensor domain-containing protein/DNA-binding NarL/FixJ family response regulator
MSECKCHRLMQERIIIIYLILTILLVSCSTNRQEAEDEMPLLYPHPLTAKLNTEGGYAVNPVTGDSIQPIINSFGDTLKTGVPLPARGYKVDPGILEKPLVIPAGTPEVVPITRNVHKIPEELTIIPVNKDSLRSYTPGKDIFLPFTLVNSMGDTIPTGVPIPVKGKVVPCRMPLPVKAPMPRLRSNARINMKYLDVDQGLNSSNVRAIIKDSQGNLWFGTWGGGVSKYNGESFTHFTEKEGLSDNYIWTMMEDRQGNLWFGTYRGGVCMYNGESFTHFTEKQGLSTNSVRSILEDRKGNLWFGTWGGGLILYDGKTLTHFTKKEGLNSHSIFSMVEDSHYNIWIGALGGVSMYNGKTFTHFTSKEGLICDLVWCVQKDSQGNLWFGTNDGVSMYDGQSFTNYTEKEGLIHNFVGTMMEDSFGNIWFGTAFGAASRYDGESFTNYGDEEGLSPSDMMSIQEDSYGNIWLGTVSLGVSIYNPQTLVHYTQKEGLRNNIVSSILEDSKGNLWFGSGGNGVTIYNGEVFRHFTTGQGLASNFITYMQKDSHGNLWFGMEIGGVVMYNGKAFTLFTGNGYLLQSPILSIQEDSQGNLWFGTWTTGVIRYDGKTFTHFTEKEGFSNNNEVRSILEDSHGNLWFSTGGGGVSRYDGQGFTNFTRREGLNDNFVWCMLEDGHGNLWFGTENGGANMYDGDSFTYFTEKEGLSNNSVRSIVEDNNGNIWLGTLKGLNCLVFSPESDPGRANRNWPVIYTFNEQDGLKGIEFNNNSVLLDSKNRLWWGTGKCLTMMDMSNFKLPVEAPSNMQLSRIEINGKFVDYRHLEKSSNKKMQLSGVARFCNYPLNLKLPYKYNHLTFYYSAIDWSAPYKIKYSYKMEGLRASWSEPSAETKADYRNLPSGTFTFKVRAIGAAQKWSEPFEYTFTIHPPWWYSWWAYIIYGIIIILIILQYRRYLLRKAKLQSAVEIERIEKEKVLELDHLKSRFFANISHEFRTPLTLILGPIEGLLKKKGKEAVLKSDELGILHRNAKRLQQLINQLLDIAKLETGKVRLQVSEGNLSEHIRAIVLSFLSLAEGKNIRYKYDLPDNPDQVYFDRDKLEKIVTNLISNAFKFTAPGGEVFVALKYIMAEGQDAAEFIKISIRDSGKGIPPDQLEKIFDRFYQVGSSDTREHEGTGIGLSLTRELTDIYRGEIKVESEPGKGSLFTVVLPVSREHFKAEEIVESVADKTGRMEYQSAEIFEDFPDVNEINAGHTVEAGSEHPVILIVEDNADLRKYISANLKDKYRILEAENGQKGLARAIDEIPDLVITDLMMPEMDGIELCRQIRNDQRTNHIPVVMLTAKADKESKLEGLSTGADDYLIKPFDADELLVRVDNLIRQRRSLRDKYRMEFAMNDSFTKEIPDLEDDFLTRVVNCILAHLGEYDFGVEQLANDIGFSRSQLHRKLSSLTGYVPNKFIRNIRLKQAARMFQEGHTNITRVLYSVGFSTPSHFSQSFRDFFGVNPSDYLKNYKDYSA